MCNYLFINNLIYLIMKKQRLELDNAVANYEACAVCALCFATPGVPDAELALLAHLVSGE